MHREWLEDIAKKLRALHEDVAAMECPFPRAATCYASSGLRQGWKPGGWQRSATYARDQQRGPARKK
jgi:hypothetical protein